MEAHDLVSIAEQAPDSAFVIHRQSLIANATLIRQVAEASGSRILLGLKGFACHSTFPCLKPYVGGVSASSPHEARLAREEMGGEVHVYSPAYSASDIHSLLPLVDHIVFNSVSQKLRFAPEVKAFGKPISIGVRINPEHSEAKTPLYDPCSPRSRLGIRRKDWDDQALADVEGLHFHSLCASTSHALERTLDAVARGFGTILNRMHWFNFGGGHAITRPDYDRDHLVSILRNWQDRFPNARVYLEPSEAFGVHTGVLKATVLDIIPAPRDGYPIAMLNVSATAHMPDTLEMPYRPDVHGADQPGVLPFNYTLGGQTCLAGDVIGDYSFAKRLQVGDPLLLMDMTHYTMVKTTFFNGVQMPAIALYDSETRQVDVVRRFGYEDYRNKLS
ncbi:MAG: carboxynorspermidine decarboxylase [Opitutales bacterium]|nr:carboxynorspermidine decarboxylase [Opitutales bacterium]